MDRFSNMDWDAITTPINVPIYEGLLKKSHYDSDKTEFLVKGFKEGYDEVLKIDKTKQEIFH